MKLARSTWAIAALAIGFGVWEAARQSWLCDDAFISFRYAANLVHGLGLVYNAGERVEGYSNFLWTVWTALGMKLGVEPERWAPVWGIACYAGSLAVLAWLAVRRARARGGAAVPIAALLGAIHPDWQAFATSGLETSAFTFLAVLGMALATTRRSARATAAAGFVLGLAALTRPDGVLLAAIAGAFVASARPPRLRSAALFAGAFAVAFVPYAFWKLSYYGDLLPNTYYAKSAYLAWWSQGWIYAGLFFERYWLLALAVPAALAALVVGALRASRSTAENSRKTAARKSRDEAEASSPHAAGDERGAAGELALALATAALYTLYVVRVGGDFMFARLLIPTVPFFLIALERAAEILTRGSSAARWGVAALALVGQIATPMPLDDDKEVHGIVDEPRIYTRDAMTRTRNEGLTLRRYFDGLPVRLAYVGSQAALAYYARPPVAIECQTGLTDSTIAHRHLERRGRIGHEKVAPVDYLLQRRVDFVIHRFAGVTLDLDAELPFVVIDFDTIPGRIVHWDPPVLAEVRRRGARFVDVTTVLDQYGPTLETLTDEQAADAFARMRRFYFDGVDDPRRRAMFEARLARGGHGTGANRSDLNRLEHAEPVDQGQRRAR